MYRFLTKVYLKQRAKRREKSAINLKRWWNTKFKEVTQEKRRRRRKGKTRINLEMKGLCCLYGTNKLKRRKNRTSYAI